jgi:hypothetical protein
LGVGAAERVDALEVRWPSGRVQTRSDLPVNSLIDWAEPD